MKKNFLDQPRTISTLEFELMKLINLLIRGV